MKIGYVPNMYHINVLLCLSTKLNSIDKGKYIFKKRSTFDRVTYFRPVTFYTTLKH